MRITLDAEACTGHGRCYSLAPELFDADEDGHSMVLQADVPDDLRERAWTAVQNCPERALSLDDE